MEEGQLYKSDFSGDPLPEDAPSADQAWQEMRSRLEEEMPEAILLPAAVTPFDSSRRITVSQRRARKAGFTALLLLLFLFSWWGFEYVGKAKKTATTASTAVIRDSGIRSRTSLYNKDDGSAGAVQNNSVSAHADKEALAQRISTDSLSAGSLHSSFPFKNRHRSFAGPAYSYRTLRMEGEKPLKKNKQSSGRSIRKESNRLAGARDTTSAADPETAVDKVIGNPRPAGNSNRADAAGGSSVSDSSVAGKKATGKISSVPSEAAASDEDNTTDISIPLKLQAGLSWSAPIPTAGSRNYFSGTNGSSAPWRYALPGIWASLQHEKSLFMLELDPFATAMVRNTAFDSTIKQVDAQTSLSTTNHLNKIFGFALRFNYYYNVSGNWWAGAELQPVWWSTGVATSQQKLEKTGPGGTVLLSNSSDSYVISGSDWSQFSKFQIFTNAELLYKAGRWQAGLRAGYSFTHLADQGQPRNSFNSSLFFRVALYEYARKKLTE